MLLNMADLGKCWKSLQTFWKDSYRLANGFLSACGTVWMDFGWIRYSPKLADFEQKPWAIAHAFEHGGFGQVLEIAPNFWKDSYMLPNGFLSACGTIWMDFGWIRQGPKLADWAKSLGYSPSFWPWPILAIVGNRTKLSERTPICFQMDF